MYGPEMRDGDQDNFVDERQSCIRKIVYQAKMSSLFIMGRIFLLLKLILLQFGWVISGQQNQSTLQMALLYKNLSRETDYHHDIDAYEENRATKQIQRETMRKISEMRTRPQSLSVVRRHKKQIAYNKWYINPQLQYKQQSQNPKNDKKMLNDQDYVYKNLRNPEFWNWVHPFQIGKLPALKTPNNLDKIDTQVLQGFKKYIENTPTSNKRLPSIVQHVLAHKKTNRSPEKE